MLEEADKFSAFSWRRPYVRSRCQQCGTNFRRNDIFTGMIGERYTWITGNTCQKCKTSHQSRWLLFVFLNAVIGVTIGSAWHYGAKFFDLDPHAVDRDIAYAFVVLLFYVLLPWTGHFKLRRVPPRRRSKKKFRF